MVSCCTDTATTGQGSDESVQTLPTFPQKVSNLLAFRWWFCQIIFPHKIKANFSRKQVPYIVKGIKSLTILCSILKQSGSDESTRVKRNRFSPFTPFVWSSVDCRQPQSSSWIGWSKVILLWCFFNALDDSWGQTGTDRSLTFMIPGSFALFSIPTKYCVRFRLRLLVYYHKWTMFLSFLNSDHYRRFYPVTSKPSP